MMKNHYKNTYNILFALLTSLALAGCSVYRMEVQQGNAISNEMIAQLKPGMSKDEVISLLGNPLMQDDFHKNRWDYVYTIKHGSHKKAEKKSITLLFQNGQLLQVKQ